MRSRRNAGVQRQALCRGALFWAAAALGAERLAGDPSGLGPRCHHLGHPLHRVGHQRGLSRLCDSRWPGRSCRPMYPMPGAASGCACCGNCGPPSPSPGRSSCWPIVACMPAGCFAGSSGWGGIHFCVSTAGGPFARTRRPRTARCSASCPSPGHAGGAPAPPSKVPSGACAAHCWPAGRRATTDPWLILTDLPPDASEAGWYGLRAWIEQQFKCHQTRGLAVAAHPHDPARTAPPACGWRWPWPRCGC